MMHKVVMSSLHIIADDHFTRHDKGRFMSVFLSPRVSERNVAFSALAPVPDLCVSGFTWPPVAPVVRKLFLNFKQIYVVFSSMEGKQTLLSIDDNVVKAIHNPSWVITSGCEHFFTASGKKRKLQQV